MKKAVVLLRVDRCSDGSVEWLSVCWWCNSSSDLRDGKCDEVVVLLVVGLRSGEDRDGSGVAVAGGNSQVLERLAVEGAAECIERKNMHWC